MSRSILDPRLCFVCEYVDDMANLVREFQLLYFYDDNSVELTELKTKKIYLRRITCPGLSKEQFYLGGNVMIYGRVIKLTRFGDEVTRQLCEESAEYTSIVLSEALLPRLGSVLAVLTEECGFGVKAMQSVVLSPDAAAKAGIEAFAGKRAVVIQAVRRQAVQCGQEFASRIGKSVAVAQNRQEADAWQFLFDEPSSALQGDYSTSVVIIKPHALQRVLGGEIIQLLINEGLQVSAVCLRALSAHQADVLLQPYKGVLVDYSATVQSISGNTWVVQYSAGAGAGCDADVVGKLRAACGPFDPAVAKALAPRTIRGRFGVDRVFNAVHCTDVAGDAVVYAGFLFRPSA